MVNTQRFAACELGQIDAITVSNANLSFTVLSYGATIQKILVKDRQGGVRDVCLGYDSLEEYRNNDGYFGAAIGRNGNRIGNAQFTLNGKVYQLSANEGCNQLHGGKTGLDKKCWAYQTERDSVTFMQELADGEEGFPGNIHIEVTYSIDGENGLRIDYRAVSDQDTVANFTNHTYFNLNGAGSGTILDHELYLNAEYFTPTDKKLIPTGQLAPVGGTCMDFRTPCAIGKRLDEGLLFDTKGYDHNFCLSGQGLRKVGSLFAPESGIRMDVETTLEGIQIYSGNSTSVRKGKESKMYGRYSAVCLETQHYPNAVNCPAFPSPILKKGDNLHETTIYRFF